jgi:hypothetical protein
VFKRVSSYGFKNLVRSGKFANTFYISFLISGLILFNIFFVGRVFAQAQGPVVYVNPDRSAKYSYGGEPYTEAKGFDKYDTLIVDSGESVYVDCFDKYAVPYYSGAYSMIKECGGSGYNGGDETIFPKGLSVDEIHKIPYILSPRSSLVNSARPQIQWNALKDVKKYDLSLFKNGEPIGIVFNYITNKVNVGEFDIDFERIEYPSAWEELQLGDNYEVVVHADNGTSSRDERIVMSDYEFSRRGVEAVGGHLSFKLLDQSTKEILEPRLTFLSCKNYLSCEDSRRTLSLSILYNRLHLHSDAIQLLENLARRNSKEPIETYRFLAEYYAHSGLEQLARETFKKAEKNAKESNNAEEIKNIKQAFDKFKREQEKLRK